MISESTLEILEYSKLLRILAEPVHSPATREAVLNIRPMATLSAIKQRQGLVAEIRRMAIDGNPLRLFTFADLRPFL